MKTRYIKAIRAFNRFYTKIIGLLDGHILYSSYSLPEVRIMFELYHHDGLTASDIIELLGIDKGYLSRILKNLEKNKLISKVGSKADRRTVVVQLTVKGRQEFEVLNQSSNRQVENIFKGLNDSQCESLIQKMLEIQQLLEKKLTHEAGR